MTNDEIDGTNGHTLNSTVWKFPPNLESFDLTYLNQSLLPSGQVTRLDNPSADNPSKRAFYNHQSNFRRDPGPYEAFYDEGVQQYIALDLRDLYLQQEKLTQLDHLQLILKFNNNLSPNNYQIGLTAVTEKKLILKPSGEHGIVNAAGKPQIQG
jgi:hypothetical protein